MKRTLLRCVIFALQYHFMFCIWENTSKVYVIPSLKPKHDANKYFLTSQQKVQTIRKLYIYQALSFFSRTARQTKVNWTYKSFMFSIITFLIEELFGGKIVV